ncbi:MAG: hypothetical protein K0Q66_1814 [Chitinophagaceae bacterium]|jgi:hypothetical protein|nr:hypothetical protein [Chitinophagaceae bacterium]
MKKLFVLLFVICGFAGFSQTSADVKFTVKKHSFGKIKQNVPVTYTFTFTNASTSKALIVESAEAECGCTKPVYPEAPIGKGKKGTIKVTYDAKSAGTFTKKVTVKFANIAEPVILVIDGDVKAATKK